MRDASSQDQIPSALLGWYDTDARTLPWRIGPAARASGVKPDPYRVWLSEIMLQQTTVATVTSYFERFTTRWPRVADLAAAEDSDVMGAWAGLGYYARARNLLKCARVVVAEYGGAFPDSYEGLITLPGIGPYTAGAIAAIAFDRPAPVMDGNVERVVARLFEIMTPLPAAKSELMALVTRLTPDHRPGDYAQAVMDLGATICTPRSPACGLCPVRTHCRGFATGRAVDLPRKAPKKTKPTRHGTIYLGQRSDGAWLLERRPEKGLLGGMLGWPGSDWAEAAHPAPPIEADWRRLPGEVRHTFTHFHLVLQVFIAHLEQDAAPTEGFFLPHAELHPATLPTLMRKAFDFAAPALRQSSP